MFYNNNQISYKKINKYYLLSHHSFIHSANIYWAPIMSPGRGDTARNKTKSRIFHSKEDGADVLFLLLLLNTESRLTRGLGVWGTTCWWIPWVCTLPHISQIWSWRISNKKHDPIYTQLKTGSNYMLSTRKYFKYNNLSRLQVKGYKKMYHASINQKKTGVSIY